MSAIKYPKSHRILLIYLWDFRNVNSSSNFLIFSSFCLVNQCVIKMDYVLVILLYRGNFRGKTSELHTFSNDINRKQVLHVPWQKSMLSSAFKGKSYSYTSWSIFSTVSYFLWLEVDGSPICISMNFEIVFMQRNKMPQYFLESLTIN